MSYADTLDFWDDDAFENDFCECGVTLLDGENMCATCRCAPHGRDCPCDECSDYWERVCRESVEAADVANRALLCSCGWTGPFIEHHRDRQPDCEVRYRDPEQAAFWRERGWDSQAWTAEQVAAIESSGLGRG